MLEVKELKKQFFYFIPTFSKLFFIEFLFYYNEHQSIFASVNETKVLKPEIYQFYCV